MCMKLLCKIVFLLHDPLKRPQPPTTVINNSQKNVVLFLLGGMAEGESWLKSFSIPNESDDLSAFTLIENNKVNK